MIVFCGLATHFAHGKHGLPACGISNARRTTAPREVSCMRCRRTKAFRQRPREPKK